MMVSATSFSENMVEVLQNLNLKFDTDDDLPLNEPLKLHLLTIIVRCIFEEDNKFLSSGLFR